MKFLKLLAALFVIALLAVGGVVYWGISHIDSLVKTAIEEAGTQALGAKVVVGSVDIRLKQGRGEISQLIISNPPGFESAQALSLGKAVVEIDPSSITDDVIVINEVTVDGAELTAEQKGLAKNNLAVLADRLAVSGDKSAPEPAGQPDSNAQSDTRIRLNHFNFTRANIFLVSSDFGERTIAMPDMILTDVGGAAGVSPEQLADVLMKKVMDQAQRALKKDLEKAAREKAKEKLQESLDDKLSEKDKAKLDSLKSLLK